MPFGITYNEILEMIREQLLQVPMCRDIVRRAGLVPQGGASTSRPTVSLWRGGDNYAPQDTFVAYYSGQNLPAGVYIFPPFDPTGAGLQLTLVDLTNIAYIRGIAAYPHGLETLSRAAFVPIYTNSMTPTTLDDWIAADGRALTEWEPELMDGSAPWVPFGSVPDPAGAEFEGAAGGAVIIGGWEAPPIEALEDPTNVLLGVAVFIRLIPDHFNVMTVDVYDVQFQAATSPVSNAFNETFGLE